jgi:hypothetical protein
MERAHEIEPHGAYFCNADDTSALEPTRDLVAKTRPELVPLIRDLEGHDSLLANRSLRDVVGWEHKTAWRDLMETPE